MRQRSKAFFVAPPEVAHRRMDLVSLGFRLNGVETPQNTNFRPYLRPARSAASRNARCTERAVIGRNFVPGKSRPPDGRGQAHVAEVIFCDIWGMALLSPSLPARVGRRV